MGADSSSWVNALITAFEETLMQILQATYPHTLAPEEIGSNKCLFFKTIINEVTFYSTTKKINTCMVGGDMKCREITHGHGEI